MEGEVGMKPEDYPENDPCPHVAKIHGMLKGVMNHCREDVAKVSDTRAQALFETTAEVLGGLKTAYEHYVSGRERGMTDD